MARVYVSLDIETTGLDVESDSILEVGAVRFKGPHVFETYNQLINPGRGIPYKIQQLTGITPDLIKDAPPIQEILSDLSRFVGNSPIIGHNIGFDLSFLRRHGLCEQNVGIDTFELASILLPYANRYSLSALLDYLNVEVSPEEQFHRALDDAQATRHLFEALLDQARRLDAQIIKEVARLGARSQWPLSFIFRDLSRERRHSAPASSLGQQLAAKGLVSSEGGGFSLMQQDDRSQLPPPLKPVEDPQPLDLIQLCKLLEKDGLFEQQFQDFEYRPQQVDMLAHIVGALNDQQHLLVEAGTGTGKSMAYLIPALYWATQNKQRVVISTNTINLQDQLLTQDIPTLKKILPMEFRAVALKGRSNYVCPRRVQMMRMKEKLSQAESRLLAKILVWLPSTTTGDREELFIPDYEERARWNQVSSDSTICTPDICTPETCFYARARRAAESAHVIVINHALLLSDVAVEGRVIPEYHHLIIDETHHLEDSITRQLTFRIEAKTLLQLLNELSQRRDGRDYIGFFKEIAQRCSRAIPNQLKGDVTDIIHQGHKAVAKATKANHRLFKELDIFVNEFSHRSSYNIRIRLTDQTRSRPAWSNVELSWDLAEAALQDASQAIGVLHTLILELEAFDIEHWEELLSRTLSYRTRLDEMIRNLRTILVEPSKESILWVEKNMRVQAVSLHNAPLHVGNLVLEHLLKPKETVIFTSATMRTHNSFEYFQERLNLWEAEEAAVGSPFDYEQSTLLYLPTNIPEPNAQGYQAAVSRGLIDLAKRIDGRTLVLFTSYNQLRNVARAIKKPLAEADIVVYQQGDGSSRRQLLENFKEADKAILLGTRSFWEGVDIPGPALSCVVITRIPFAVPNDPIIAARSETFDDAFTQYAIPQAILMFRQGFGRLIRKKGDRGVVAVFDRRVISKSYGPHILDSLPTVTEHRGLLANLPKVAEDWIEHGIIEILNQNG